MMTNNILQDVFTASGDEVFICNIDGSIKYKNPIAQNKYPKISNINKLAHFFNFEICILKSEEILSYNPIKAALDATETFFANITKQVKDSIFEEYTITSLFLNDDERVVILRNDNQAYTSLKYIELEEKNSKLEEQILASQDLKLKLENQLVRTNLINFVSQKVQEYINTKKILKITIEQLEKTLDITKAEFAFDEGYKLLKVTSEVDNKKSKSKLLAPVYQDKKVFGVLILYKKASQNMWQKDEIELVKSVCSLLSTSFAKEELYNALKKQKTELEEALAQLKDAQLQIVQSEKMAALGQLVAGVAHEINTPLGVVISNMGMLEECTQRASDINKLKNFVSEVSPINKEALRRIENLVKTLKNFARLDEAKKKKVNIIDGIKSTLTLLNQETKSRIQIKENYEKIPPVSCYPDYINQVFMNILLNACQSIKDKGSIEIRTFVKDNAVVVAISDTGEGISKSNIKKIFDFGFTTKKIGQGTGLGLALAKKIIEEHSGKIEVESSLGHGTTFRISVPIESEFPY
ncbi:MAG: GHKL domain-containing protein [bacterium]|nr:GHKL domain-containing protein [bacterium]